LCFNIIDLLLYAGCQKKGERAKMKELLMWYPNIAVTGFVAPFEVPETTPVRIRSNDAELKRHVILLGISELLL
jgi:hypothetical protein